MRKQISHDERIVSQLTLPNAHDLPPQWRVVRLGEVFAFTQKPKGLRYSDFEYVPFVPMEFIPDDNLFLISLFSKLLKS